MPTVIGQVECPACGEKANVQEAKAGSLVIWCNGANGCRSQTFVKTPKAVESLRRKLSGQPPEPTPEPKKKSFWDVEV
jgi:hypothetical protein